MSFSVKSAAFRIGLKLPIKHSSRGYLYHDLRNRKLCTIPSTCNSKEKKAIAFGIDFGIPFLFCRRKAGLRQGTTPLKSKTFGRSIFGQHFVWNFIFPKSDDVRKFFRPKVFNSLKIEKHKET